MKKHFSVYDIVAVGLMAALLFGAARGGHAAGLGSMIYDMMDPRYLPTCWLTFLMKFAMGWVCGKLCGGSKNVLRQTLSAAAGSAT